MRALVFMLILSAPSAAFAWRQSTTCIRPEDVDPLAPTAAERCTGTERPLPFVWEKLEVPYAVGEAGSVDFPTQDGMISDALLAEIQTSFSQWSAEQCSEFEFVYDGTSEIAGHRFDGINWVGFLEEEWPHASGAIAVSTITTQLDGVIADADMELNGLENTFVVVDAETTGDVYDVRNVVTHEAGHMLGLDHSRVDDATMQFSSPPRQIEKRDLEPDDVEGLCTIYPLDFEPEPEPEPDRGCCRQAGSRTDHTVWSIPLIFALFWGRRRTITR